MRYGDNTTFKRSCVIQKRVIHALLMRELITRYGRKNIGFLWLFIEPLLLTLVITVAWKYIKADKFSTLNIIAFMITGYPIAMMWRNASNRAQGAISANLSLLYHRNVRVLDTIFTRVLLEVTGASIAQILLMTIFIAIGWIEMPNDIFYMLCAWILMAFFALGLGLIICTLAHYIEPFGKIWGTFSFFLLPLSGAFFFVHNLPLTAQNIALWFPMIHGTEMFRHGYFGETVITYESISYLIVSDIILLFIGLLCVRSFSKGIEPR
ncbi:TPA: ABC transporter permease [Mannheimia haemolytica]|uniref:Transport permease protein n=1 Tax=Mannheimia haemolytica TaxID=75985 RepID=A0A547EHG6_MANHA|nr:ABC transporter permease [Mannheimia haemolytica]AWW70328.1 ABC transporter permease [Pasteurellaceae bacterium 12565]AGI31339.2 sugar ABC transporter permease [Mannheimia haemolytica USDA-ARS-USMARC-183]AGK01017.1 capsule polysaccharide export inner-membrane protein BexB [Mannheimia haemolytica M42548]AGQ25918.1 sugar ABC transporter permease [Mannheimia haemolytica D153]AGR76335.1 sugar ABC transporter permease [Mannheimia haemolytica USMARC_2286]